MLFYLVCRKYASHTHTRTHTHTHYTHARSHAHTHSRTRARAHTHTQSSSTLVLSLLLAMMTTTSMQMHLDREDTHVPLHRFPHKCEGFTEGECKHVKMPYYNEPSIFIIPIGSVSLIHRCPIDCKSLHLVHQP